MKSRLKAFDTVLFVTVLILLGIGIIMILSASSHLGNLRYGTPYYFFTRQIIWATSGILIMLLVSRIDYKWYKKFAKLIFAVAVGLLVLVLIPGVGSGEIRGAKRWIDLGFFDFQPSEVAKLAVIIFLSARLSKNYKKLDKLFTGIIPNFLWVILVAVLLYLEPHYSALALVCGISVVLVFAAGAKIKIRYLIIGGILVFLVGALGIYVSDYRSERIFGFLNPWADPLDTGWQVIQSLYAIGSGGVFGLGLGKSMQKYLYLSDAHNDFILAIIGEELGLVGMTLVIGLFITLAVRGIIIATKSKDMFGGLLATGITVLISTQVILNIAIVTGWFPVTGMPVPFLSYGGTSMIIFSTMIGILLNISRNSENL